MTRRPGTRIVDTIDHGERQINGMRVYITESVWNGGGRSFDVYLDVDGDGDGECLTEESLDTLPTDEQIAALLPTCSHPADRQYVKDGQFYCGLCNEWLGR